MCDHSLLVLGAVDVVYRYVVNEWGEGDVVVSSELFINEHSSSSRVDEGRGFDGSVNCDWNTLSYFSRLVSKTSSIALRKQISLSSEKRRVSVSTGRTMYCAAKLIGFPPFPKEASPSSSAG